MKGCGCLPLLLPGAPGYRSWGCLPPCRVRAGRGAGGGARRGSWWWRPGGPPDPGRTWPWRCGSTGRWWCRPGPCLRDGRACRPGGGRPGGRGGGGHGGSGG
ncbi:hypothetical protein EUA66_01245 [TM7 phylum sp. oral taxon 349]|nr:hypothetical protein EUA66_01245 [TM7 phylum sp. oral taxon 349]